MTIRVTSMSGYLGALRRDKRGNTLAIAAASLIPIAAMIGSGLDASRTYLVKARLQSACDAGALAARKSMDGSGTLNAAAQTAGDKFFENNFPTGTYGTSNRTFVMALDASKQVVGTARVRVPMTLMKMFSYEHSDLTASCMARLDITNTDVMFVLDTTGSMAGDRIVGLRAAVVDFTKTLAGAVPGDARIRYGFVPYSSTVNVGALLPSASVNSTWDYQSRVANFNTGIITSYRHENGPNKPETEVGPDRSREDCLAWGSDYGSGPIVLSAQGNDAKGRRYSNTEGDWVSVGDGTRGTCKRTYVERNYVDPVIKYRFTNWTYKQESYEAGGFKTSAVAVAMDTPRPTYYTDTQGPFDLTELAALPNYSTQGGSVENFQWDGCIEERNTVADAVTSSYDIAADAWDLDIDRPAGTLASNWRASWPHITWHPNGGFGLRPWDFRGSGYYACPAPARKLATMTEAQVQTYVDTLVPVGGTYHDTGLIWGARLISPTGIFGSENTTAPNAQPIARNIVFMTDGSMAPNELIVGMYGFEILDQRVTGGTPNTADLRDRHNKRYRAMCKEIIRRGINLYVVAFGEPLNDDMKACSPGQAYAATDSDELKKKFNEIATKIARLRLSL